MAPDYFHPFSSGDRPQPAPLLPSVPEAIFLYLGAGLDLYPVASRYANFSTFLYVDAKPRLTRAPGDRDHAAWSAPEDVARSVIERSAGALDKRGWELVAPEVLRFTGRDQVTLYYVFATLDFELISRANSLAFLAQLLERVEALYVHGLYISPETNLHLPALRTVYAIPGNASCADVDFIQEHDCTPPDPSSPYYIPTRTEQEHHERLCAWAGINPSPQPEPVQLGEQVDNISPEKLERAMQLEKQLERFIGLNQSNVVKPKSPKSKSSASLLKTRSKAEPEAKPKGPPLRFVLIDQITWDDELPRGTLPPPPVPSRTGLAWEDGVGLGWPKSGARRSRSSDRRGPGRRSGERKSRSTERSKASTSQAPTARAEPVRRESIPHVLPPLSFTSSTGARGSSLFAPSASLRGFPSASSLRARTSAPQTQSLRGLPSTTSLRALASRQRAPSNATHRPPANEDENAPKRISRPRSGGGAAQGLVRCASKRPPTASSDSEHASRSDAPERICALAMAPESSVASSSQSPSRAPPRPRPRPQLGGYRIAKTVREAESVWAERDRKERERMREERVMRERAIAESIDKTHTPKRKFLNLFASGWFRYEFSDRGHAHTV